MCRCGQSIIDLVDPPHAQQVPDRPVGIGQPGVVPSVVSQFDSSQGRHGRYMCLVSKTEAMPRQSLDGRLGFGQTRSAAAQISQTEHIECVPPSRIWFPLGALPGIEGVEAREVIVNSLRKLNPGCLAVLCQGCSGLVTQQAQFSSFERMFQLIPGITAPLVATERQRATVLDQPEVWVIKIG